MKTQLLRPGYMIALKSELNGGVAYELHDQENTLTGQTLTRRRESTTTVLDVEEHDRAVKVRGAALYLIRKCTVKTPFSLLCPDENEFDLDVGVASARALVDDFNASAKHTRISLYVLRARLMGDDEQTAKAVAEEMRSLLSEMSAAIAKMDPAAIREAAQKADEVSRMFQEDKQEQVSTAIALARKSAREITKNIKKAAGGAVAVASDYQITLLAVEEARQSFLDFEEPVTVAAEDEAPPVQMKDLDIFSIGEDASEDVSVVDVATLDIEL